MRNGMKELKPGQWFTLNGQEMQFVKVENDNVTIRDKKGNTFSYGFAAFWIIMHTNGYEVIK